MSGTPSHERIPGYGHAFQEPLTTRRALLDDMQRVAPPGQSQLDPTAAESLRRLTVELLAAEQGVAEGEHDRFRSVEQRGLHLDTARLHEQLRGRTILVTGGTGCIGATLLGELTQFDPARVVSVSRGLTAPWDVVSGVEYGQVDIRDKQGLEDVFKAVKPDIVYHLAAQRDPSLAENTVAHTLSTNITGTHNVIEAARGSATAQIVYASTGKAVRPFTSDTYAASKKVSEFLMADAARRGDILCAGVRFTHVVDNSIIHQRLQNWITTDSPIRLHGTDIPFYMQSARESAHLLLNAGLDARRGQLDLHAIRNLDWPINLVDLALGALSHARSTTPIYFCGFESGYEEQAYPGLYDPLTSGEVSPLISAFEASQTDASESCAQVDRFPFEISTNNVLARRLHNLEAACAEGAPDGALHQARDELSWAMLDARLRRVVPRVLQRTAQRMEILSGRQPMNEEHTRINDAVRLALGEAQ